MAVQVWTGGWFVGITPAGRSPPSSSLAWPSPSFARRSTIASTFRSRSVKHRISTERMSSSISASDAIGVDRRKRKQFLELPSDEVMTLAEEDIRDNWERYQEEFLRRDIGGVFSLRWVPGRLLVETVFRELRELPRHLSSDSLFFGARPEVRISIWMRGKRSKTSRLVRGSSSASKRYYLTSRRRIGPGGPPGLQNQRSA